MGVFLILCFCFTPSQSHWLRLLNMLHSINHIVHFFLIRFLSFQFRITILAGVRLCNRLARFKALQNKQVPLASLCISGRQQGQKHEFKKEHGTARSTSLVPYPLESSGKRNVQFNTKIQIVEQSGSIDVQNHSKGHNLLINPKIDQSKMYPRSKKGHLESNVMQYTNHIP